MESQRLRKRVITDLLSAPVTLVPTVAGVSSVLVGLGLGIATAPLCFVGVAGIIAGIGALAMRWIFGADRIIRRHFEAMQQEEVDRQEARLDALDARLQTDDDPATEASLRELRRLYASFKEDARALRISGKSAVEVGDKVERLFRGCLHNLERSLVLWETANGLRTASERKRVLEMRRKTIDEVETSIQQLSRTLDSIRTLSVGDGGGVDLARIRGELDESLAVARRVEERMQAMEAELGRSDRHKE